MSTLVKLKPIEYDTPGNRIRVWKYEFYHPLSVKKLKDICKSKNMLEQPNIFQSSNGLVYHYPKKPMLVIKDGEIYTTKESLIEFGKIRCAHQATILLRLLYYPKKKRRILRATRTSIPLSRLSFLETTGKLNITKSIGDLDVTLVRAGEYKPDNYYRMGFDLILKNNATKLLIIDIYPTISGSQHSRILKRKIINVEPKKPEFACFYTSRLKTKTLNPEIILTYNMNNKIGTLRFKV